MFLYCPLNNKNKRRDIAEQLIERLIADNIPSELIVADGTLSQEEVFSLIKACDVVLMLSDQEGSPTVVQESVALGTPVLSFDVGDVVTLFDSCPIVVISSRDIDELYIKLFGMLTKVNESQIDAEILKKISKQEIIKKINELYVSLVEGEME